MLTIKEAIEILSQPGLDLEHQFTPAFRDAVKLGIEALKMVKRERESDGNPIYVPLIGETKEEGLSA